MQTTSDIYPMPQAHADEIDLRECGRTLWRRRWGIASFSGFIALATALISFSMPDRYTSSATLMPLGVPSEKKFEGVLSQAGQSHEGTISDKLVALLESRTLAEKVLMVHGLTPALYAEASRFPWLKPKPPRDPSLLDAVRRLDAARQAQANPKNGILTVSVTHSEPQTAAALTNAYLMELETYLRDNSLTSARRNRQFLEQRLQEASQEVTRVESALRSFQEKHMIVALDAQTNASVQAYATVASQLMAKETELSLQSRSVSENDVGLIGLKREIARYQGTLKTLEKGGAAGLIGFGTVPELSMRYAQLQRELATKQKGFELVSEQLELAKIEESKQALSFQVIDQAVPPDQKSAPNRSIIILVATLAAVFLSSLALLLMDSRRQPRTL